MRVVRICVSHDAGIAPSTIGIEPLGLQSIQRELCFGKFGWSKMEDINENPESSPKCDTPLAEALHVVSAAFQSITISAKSAGLVLDISHRSGYGYCQS